MINKQLKICIVVNVDWFVLSHFKHYLSTIVAAGHNVTLLTAGTGKALELSNLGVTVLEVKLHRGSSDILNELRQIKLLYSTLKDVMPDVLELITIKPVLYGGLCAKLLGLQHVVFYMSGLGSQFTSRSIFGRFKRSIIVNCYRFLMSSGLKRVIVENSDDYRLFLERVNVQANRLFKIGGVGVDLHQFSPQKRDRKEQVNVGMVSRLLHDKGVMEFYQSAYTLSRVHNSVQFHLAGEIDPSNPASLTEVEVREISDSAVIKLHGHIDEIDSFLTSIDIFVLPSYREGFPRAIMEASAMGVPVVACDVTGCKDAVVPNHTGLLCVAMDSVGLTGAIERVILDNDLRRRLGNGGRQYALCNFDEEIISKAHLNILEGTLIE